MADELVLARLTMDPSGVVSGMNTTDAALMRGDKTLKTFGTSAATVANRLTNFRGALLTLARSFGVIGLVTSLAFALKGLITQVITSSAWFKTAAENVTNWWKAMVEGEKAVDRMARTMARGDVTGKLAEFNKLMKERTEILSKLSGPTPAGVQITAGMVSGGLMGALGGLTALLPQAGPDKTSPAVTSAMKAEVDSLTQRIEKLGKELHEAGVTGLEAFGNLTGRIRLTKDELAALMKEATDTFAAWTGNKGLVPGGGGGGGGTGSDFLFEVAGIMPPEQFADRMGILIASLKNLRANIATVVPEQAQLAMHNIVAEFEAMGFSAEQAKQIIERFGLVLEDVSTNAWQDFKQSLEEGLNTTSVAIDVTTTAINQLASSMTAAFTSGNFTFKKFFAEMLHAIGTTLMGYAAMATVMGFIVNPAFFAAAGIGFAAAAAAFTAARLLGGGGSEPARGGGGGGGGSLSAGPERNQTVTVNILGSLIGTDKDELARTLGKWIATAQADGAR